MQLSREQVLATDSALQKVVPLKVALGDPAFGVAIHAASASCAAIPSSMLSGSSLGSLQVLCRCSEGSFKAICKFACSSAGCVHMVEYPGQHNWRDGFRV